MNLWSDFGSATGFLFPGAAVMLGGCVLADLPPDPAVAPEPTVPAPNWRDQVGLATVAGCLVIAALSWYLLREFAPVLRPLLLAVFLCYIILPSHRQLTRRVPTAVSILVLASASIGLIVLLAMLIYGSAIELNEEMPHLLQRGEALLQSAEKFYLDHLPPWLAGDATDLHRGPAQPATRIRDAVSALAGAAGDVITEAALVGIYLVFLLVEAGRVPRRIQGAFSGDRPEQILAVMGNINKAMASYLRVKVKVSLVLAVPVTLVLWAFGVKFALMWGVLTFTLNFVPYLGSVIACGAPMALAFLQMDPLKAASFAAILVTIHLLSAYLIEPSLTGKAVGLSPVVILVALSFWGLCWGLIGMLLAVPLTVMLKIVLENVAFTRPMGKLMGED